ncbi:MAG: flagellar biosynthesis protein FlhB [Tepidisphaerales bacterium]
MAEDFDDKTEAPTPRRREEAREQGQVVRSQDLIAAAMILGFLLLLQGFGPGLIGALRAVTERLLSADVFSNVRAGPIDPTAAHLIGNVGVALLPILLGAMTLGVFLNIAQVGFLISFERIQLNLGVLNPLQGFSRVFAGGRGLVHLVMNLLKVGLVLAVAWTAVRGRLGQIVTLQQLDYLSAFGLGMSLVFSIALRISSLLLALAALDYAWERFNHERKLRMTKQEIKEEMRHMEGDPKIKQRRRAIAIQLVNKRLKKDVPTADVVVTNPTHFAVALKYDSGAMHAPRVVAKGADFMAKRIRELAIEAGVPIIERAPLARALYRTCDVGDEIPEQFYAAVAEILAYVYELTGKIKRRQNVA